MKIKLCVETAPCSQTKNQVPCTRQLTEIKPRNAFGRERSIASTLLSSLSLCWYCQIPNGQWSHSSAIPIATVWSKCDKTALPYMMNPSDGWDPIQRITDTTRERGTPRWTTWDVLRLIGPSLYKEDCEGMQICTGPFHLG